jgi:hypothetical protein
MQPLTLPLLPEGTTPRRKPEREDGSEGAEDQPYEYADDPYTRTLAGTDDSTDEQDVEAMLLAEQEEAKRPM